ncbi:MAG: ADOP family duplicated permease [Pyrinomonadaceae bacterium]
MPEWRKEIIRRLANLKLEPEREAEIVEELALHLEDRYDELLSAGVTEEEASRVALLELSDSDLLTKELQLVERPVVTELVALGENRRSNLIADLWQDLRYGIRVLLKAPGFTAVAVLALALGIGANTAIFSVTDKLLIRSLAVQEPQDLVLINSISVSPHFVSNSFSYPDFSDYRAQNQVLSGLLAFSRTELELVVNDRVERVASEYVSSNYFEVLGVNAARGRTFSPEEDKSAGSQPLVVVSDSFWRKRFDSSRDLIGQTINLNGIPLTVAGIAPPNFSGMLLEEPTEIWIPVLMHPQLAQSKFIENRKDRWLQLLGRVKPGVSQAQAESGLDLLAQQIKSANTPPGTVTKGLPFSEQHIKFEPGGKGISILRKRFSSPLKLLMAIVGLVLLIACANVGGLLLARGVARRKEMAIRLSLGASGWRVARQLLMESLLLAVAGGAAGVLLAPWLVNGLVRSQSQLDLARTLLGQGLDLRVLAFTAMATLLAVMVFGLVPAWQSSRPDLVDALKDEGGVSSQRDRRFGFRSVLVVSQLALAIVVLVGAGLCVKSLRNLLAIDPGYETGSLLVIPLELDEKKYDQARGTALQQQLGERLSALPGVDAVSSGAVLPLSGSRFMSSIFVEGRQPLPGEQMAFDGSVVGPRYHEAMGIKIAQGRGFTDEDRKGAPGVVIINETMASRLFPRENALGKRLSLRTGTTPLEVIGISGDVKHHDLTETPIPHFDLPALQRNYSSYTNFVVRVRGRAADLIPSVRNEVLALDPTLAVNQIKPMSAQIGNAVAAIRLASTLIAVFGVVALLLASIGLYGVMAWVVSQRTHEVGIRMALGAQVGDVLTLILRKGMLMTAIGVLIGLGLALIGTRLMESQLYGVSATDPITFAAISLLLVVVAFLACYIPARRATKVDPLVALRYE